MKLITLRCTYIAKSHSNFLSLVYEKKLAAVKGENSRLSLKHGFGGCDGLGGFGGFDGLGGFRGFDGFSGFGGFGGFVF